MASGPVTLHAAFYHWFVLCPANALERPALCGDRQKGTRSEDIRGSPLDDLNPKPADFALPQCRSFQRLCQQRFGHCRVDATPAK